MDLPKQPRWVYTDSVGAVDYSMSMPQRPWDIEEVALGGSDVAGSGIPAAYEIRRDYLMHLTLRFPESERASVTRLVRHLQRGGSATMYPDQDVVGTSHTVYGHAPAMGEPVRPTRHPEEMSTLELPITVRRTTQAEFTDAFFA